MGRDCYILIIPDRLYEDNIQTRCDEVNSALREYGYKSSNKIYPVLNTLAVFEVGNQPVIYGWCVNLITDHAAEIVAKVKWDYPETVRLLVDEGMDTGYAMVPIPWSEDTNEARCDYSPPEP